MRIVIGVLYTLLPEILLLAIALLLAPTAARLPEGGQLALEFTSGILLMAVLGLSLQFNRGRIFFTALTLLTGYLGLLALHRFVDPVSRSALYGSLCLFVPLDLLLISTMQERGIFSRHGTLWFGMLGLEILFVLMLAASGSATVAATLHVNFAQSSLFAATPVTQPGLVAFGIGLLWLNDRLILRHSSELAAFFLCMLGAAIMLHLRQPVLVAVFSATCAVALGFAIIQQSWSMAYLDELTGLPGRRALEEHMRQLGARHVIAMVDVDHFKKCNDTYGHDVGDQVLRFVASRLQQHNVTGRAFRYGGEEFSLVYPGKDLAAVQDELETLRADIASCRFDLRRRNRRLSESEKEAPDEPALLAVTVSIGAAESGRRLNDPWAVLKAADKALYDAKHAGRNRVRMAES